MDDLEGELERFRESVRCFIERNYDADAAGGQFPAGETPAQKRFLKALSDQGWLGLDWPTEYGGKGSNQAFRIVLQEELDYVQLPSLSVELAIGQVIAHHGSDVLKREFLPRIIAGQLNVALGLSEAEAGSDLAALALRATREGDSYRVNGQKLWTSAAHFADVIWLACRTDVNAPKHQGISVFLVDAKSPGIDVSPIYTMGDHRTNVVHFSDVNVPVGRLIGEENRGWTYLAESLDYERLGFPFGGLQRDLDELIAWARAQPVSDQPELRRLIGELTVRVEGARTHLNRAYRLLVEGQVPTIDATMLKIALTEARQEMADAVVEHLGPVGVVRGEPSTPGAGRFEKAWRVEIINTIAGGANELMRNVLARRHLGLPNA